MKHKIPLTTTVRTAAALLAALGVAASSQAADITKANNANNLNLTTSWVGGVVPTSASVALWDNTLSDVNNTTNTLGANLYFGGIKIVNPAGNILINAGNTLTNGALGIDMTSATVDLAFSNTVYIAPGALQQWSVASGRTLSVLAVPTKPGQPASNTGVLRVETTGTVRFGAAAATTIADNQGNPWVNYGLSDWAALDSSGNVIAVTYTSASSALTAGVFNDIVGDIGGGASSAVDVPGIRFNDSTFRTLNIANSGTARTFTCRGVLVTPNCAGGLIGGQAATSFIRPNRSTIANTAWNVIQNSPNNFTIAANIANGSSSAPTHLVKSGTGNLIVSHTGNGYSGGTTINQGTLTAAAGASLGGGAVTVNNSGRLVLTASNTTFVTSVIVNSGATNAVKVASADAQQSIRQTLTFSAGSSRCQFDFNNGIAPSLTTPPLQVSNLVVSGTVTVDVFNSVLSVGTYPLLKYTNTLTGSLSSFVLGAVPPHVGCTLSNDTTTVYLMITNVTSPLRWATGSGTWNTSTPNWVDNTATATTYQEVGPLGDTVVFEDVVSGSSPITVTLNSTVIPLGMTVTNNTKSYTISGSGTISGIGGLTKTGNGPLTLGTANTFTGGINLNGGTTVFSALNNLGAGAINFSGGTLQYNGNTDDISVRTVTFGAGGATIDTAGQTISYANPVGNAGAGSLTKNGAGSLTLSGANNYTGNTIIASGTLALNGSAGISNSAAIVVSSGTYLDASASGGIDLNGTVSQKLAGNGTVLGGVNVNSGASISPLTNGSVGTLTISNGNLTLNSGSTLMMDISSGSRDQIKVATSGYGLSINGGTLALNVTGTLPYGSYTLITYPTGGGYLFTGPASVATLSITGFAQAGAVATLDGSVDGQINLVISATATDTITWAGVGTDWDLAGTANWYLDPGIMPWAFTNGDFVTFNDVGSSYPNVSLKAPVSPSTITVTSDTTAYSFDDGGGKISGTATLTKNGAATLTVNTVNDTTGNVVVNGGTLQVNGHLGTGSISNKAELVFSQGTSRTVSGALSGAGNLTQSGSATLTLSANSPLFTGGVTVSSGTLQIGSGGATGSLGTTATITNNAALIYNRAADFSVANNIEGTGSFTKNAAGTMTLTGSNSYSGTTIASAGKLIFGSVTAHAGNGPLSIGNGATNDIGGYDLTITRLYSGTAVFGRIVNNSGTATNVLTITDAASGAADCATTIADNDGAGGKIRVVKNGAGTQAFRGASTYTGGTTINEGSLQARSQDAAFGTGPIYLNGGTLHVFAVGSLVNPIQVLTNSGIYSDGNSTMNTTLTGSSNLTVTCAGSVTSGQTLSWGSGANLTGYSGTFYCVVDNTTYGRFWRWTASGGSASAAWDLQGNFNMSVNGTGYAIQLGALSGTNGTWLSPNSTTYTIGGRNENTTFSGNVTGSGTINKVGTGTWTLDGAGYGDGITNFSSYTFSGATVVSNGTLHLTAAANPTNSSSIRIVSGATLDIGGLGYAILETNEVGAVTNIYTAVTHRLDLSTNGNAQTLTGGGTLRGSVVAYANSTINPGDGIGTLTVTTNVTLGGTLIMELNKTNSPATNDMLVVGGTLTCGGTLTVTNVGPALVGGETFKLFSTGVTGFTVTNLPALTGSLYWTNNLAVNGTITVVNPINPNPPVMQVSVSGSTMTLAWPTNAGWILQSNSVSLSSPGAWFNYPANGAVDVTTINITMDPAKTNVFYRMVKP